MCTGLTFSQPAPRRPASYGAVSDFAITPSCPAASVTSRNRWAAAASEVINRSTRWLDGTIASSADSRSLVGSSSRSTPSRCRTSKKNTDSGCSARDAAPPEPRRGDLEPVRPPVGAQRDRFAVGDQVFHRQRERRLDDLGQPRGDVVEAAGVDRHVVARAVDLDAGAVELGLENALAAESFECFGDSGRGLGQHRPDGLPDPQGEFGQCGFSAGQGGRRDGGQVAAQHRRPADGRGGHACGLGDGVGHHPGECALPQLAAEESAQERLLGLGCRGEQVRDEPRPAGLRTLARDRADLGERRVDGRHRQRRLLRGRRQRTQRRPPDADLALRQLAR